MSSPPTSYWYGFALAMGSATLFSFKPIVVKLAYEQGIDSLSLLFWRMLLALPVYVLVGFYGYRIQQKAQGVPRRYWLFACLVGLLGYYAASVFDFKGLETVSAQLGRAILYSYPTFVTLFAWLIFRQAITYHTFGALIISYLGISMILLHDYQLYGEAVGIGAFYVFLSALFFALFIVLSKPIISHLGSQVYTALAMSSAALMMMLHFLLLHQGQIDIPPVALWGHIIVLAVFCTVLPTFMLAGAINHLGASQTSIIGSIGPVLSSGFAIWLLNEAFTIYHIIGLILVIIALYILQQPKPISR